MTHRIRHLVLALAALAAIWLFALGAFQFVRHAKASPEKVRSLLASTDLSRLSPEERRSVLRQLADILNRLNAEDRRTARMAPGWDRLLSQMTDVEKGELLEQTLPSGITQMLAAFEEMPPDRRRRLLEDSLRRLREARATAPDSDPASQEQRAEDGPAAGFDTLPPELRERVVAKGLKTFMQEGSADARAQLQPVVEELQRAMETGGAIGRPFRPGRRDRPQP